MSTDNQAGRRDHSTTQNEIITAAPLHTIESLDQNLTQTQQINQNTTLNNNSNQQFQSHQSNNASNAKDANKSRPTQKSSIQRSSTTLGTLQSELTRIHNSIVDESKSKQTNQNQAQKLNPNAKQRRQKQPSNLNESIPNQQIASVAFSTDTGDFKQVMRDIDENEEEEDIETLDINSNSKQQKQNGNELSQQSFGTYSDDFYARIEEYDLPKQKVMKNGMFHDQTFSIYNTELYGQNANTLGRNTFDDKYGINAYHNEKRRRAANVQMNNFTSARNVLDNRHANPYSQRSKQNKNGNNNNNNNDNNIDNIDFINVIDDIKRSKEYKDKKDSIVSYPLEKNESYTNGLNYYEVRYQVANPMLRHNVKLKNSFDNNELNCNFFISNPRVMTTVTLMEVEMLCDTIIEKFIYSHSRMKWLIEDFNVEHTNDTGLVNHNGFMIPAHLSKQLRLLHDLSIIAFSFNININWTITNVDWVNRIFEFNGGFFASFYTMDFNDKCIDDFSRTHYNSELKFRFTSPTNSIYLVDLRKQNWIPYRFLAHIPRERKQWHFYNYYPKAHICNVLKNNNNGKEIPISEYGRKSYLEDELAKWYQIQKVQYEYKQKNFSTFRHNAKQRKNPVLLEEEKQNNNEENEFFSFNNNNIEDFDNIMNNDEYEANLGIIQLPKRNPNISKRRRLLAQKRANKLLKFPNQQQQSLQNSNKSFRILSNTDTEGIRLISI